MASAARMAGSGGGGGAAAAAIAPPAVVGTDMVRNARGRPRAMGELRVLATRYWARGHRRDEFTWMRVLSPSADMLGRYKRGEIEWGEFAAGYAGQIASDPSARAAVERLHALAVSGGRIVLYCHEEPGSPCHRHILREMVAAGSADASSAVLARFEDDDKDDDGDGATGGGT